MKKILALAFLVTFLSSCGQKTTSIKSEDDIKAQKQKEELILRNISPTTPAWEWCNWEKIYWENVEIWWKNCVHIARKSKIIFDGEKHSFIQKVSDGGSSWKDGPKVAQVFIVPSGKKQDLVPLIDKEALIPFDNWCGLELDEKNSSDKKKRYILAPQKKEVKDKYEKDTKDWLNTFPCGLMGINPIEKKFFETSSENTNKFVYVSIPLQEPSIDPNTLYIK
jgi:hypothetical protein